MIRTNHLHNQHALVLGILGAKNVTISKTLFIVSLLVLLYLHKIYLTNT